MKLNKTVCVTPGTQTQVFDLAGATYAMAIGIMENCNVKWAEATSVNGRKTWNVKTPDDLKAAAGSGLSTFSCRLPSPDGVCARVTIGFLTDSLRLTCAPESADSVLADITSRRTGGSGRKPRRGSGRRGALAK